MKNESPFSQYDKRLFLCCGLTRDRFCLPDCSRVRFDEFLHRHLSTLGYERILFFSHRGLYFFDELSYQATMFGKEHGPAKAPAQRTAKLAAAPGGLRLRRPKAAQTDAGHPDFSAKPAEWRYPDYPFTEIITLLERVIKIESPRTAFVFYTDHLDGFSDRPAVTQQFRGMLEADFRTLPPSNRNLIIFVFGFGVDELVSYLRSKPWDFLIGPDRNQPRAGLAHVVSVGPPEKDEVSRLLHHYRLTRGIKIQWQRLALIINALAANLKCKGNQLIKMEKWLEEKTEAQDKTLSMKTVRQFTGLPVKEKPARERLENLTGLLNIKTLVARQIRLFNEFVHSQPASETPSPQECRIDRLNPARGRKQLPPHFNLHCNQSRLKLLQDQVQTALEEQDKLLKLEIELNEKEWAAIRDKIG